MVGQKKVWVITLAEKRYSTSVSKQVVVTSVLMLVRSVLLGGGGVVDGLGAGVGVGVGVAAVTAVAAVEFDRYDMTSPAYRTISKPVIVVVCCCCCPHFKSSPKCSRAGTLRRKIRSNSFFQSQKLCCGGKMLPPPCCTRAEEGTQKKHPCANF